MTGGRHGMTRQQFAVGWRGLDAALRRVDDEWAQDAPYDVAYTRKREWWGGRYWEVTVTKPIGAR